MRALMISAVVLALPVTAQAAPLDLVAEFQAVCVANRLDATQAIAAATARGYAVSGGQEAAKPAASTLIKTVDGKRWVVRVSVSREAPSPTKRGQATTICSVGGQDTGAATVDTLHRWAAVPALDPTPNQTVYVYREVGGRHLPLVSTDDAGVRAAMDAGGVYLFRLSVNDGSTVATLSRTVSGF